MHKTNAAPTKETSCVILFGSTLPVTNLQRVISKAQKAPDSKINRFPKSKSVRIILDCTNSWAHWKEYNSYYDSQKWKELLFVKSLRENCESYNNREDYFSVSED